MEKKLAAVILAISLIVPPAESCLWFQKQEPVIKYKTSYRFTGVFVGIVSIFYAVAASILYYDGVKKQGMR